MTTRRRPSTLASRLDRKEAFANTSVLINSIDVGQLVQTVERDRSRRRPAGFTFRAATSRREGTRSVTPSSGSRTRAVPASPTSARATVKAKNARVEVLEELFAYVQETSPVRDVLANAVPVTTTVEVVQER